MTHGADQALFERSSRKSYAMPQFAAFPPDANRQVERLERGRRRYPDSHELDGWTVIADGTNYRTVKTVTVEWLEARGLEPEQAEDLDLRLDFLAGRGDTPTIRTRLRSDLLDRHLTSSTS
jgi:hypothetical protein